MAPRVIKKLKTTQLFKTIFGMCFYVVLRLLFFSYRLQTTFVDSRGRVLKNINPNALHGVFYFWHQQIVAGMFFFFKNRAQGSCVVSPSDDGKIVGYLCRKLGFNVLYGSSHKQPISLLRQSLNALKNDGKLCLVGDGSRGPAFVLQPGVSYLAEKTDSPLFFVQCSTSHAITFTKSWDQFKVPFPFTAIKVTVHVPDSLMAKEEHKET